MPAPKNGTCLLSAKELLCLLVKCSPNTLVNSCQVFSSVRWVSFFKNRRICLWKKPNKDLVLCKFIIIFLMSGQGIIFVIERFSQTDYDFFFGSKSQNGWTLFFLESKEQAAVANAALPATLNLKLESPLSTYSLALDFLPRHLEPGPSISLRTRLRQRNLALPHPPNLSIWKETSCHWISPFLILTCVRTGDQSIRKGITWADVWTGSNWDTQIIPKGFFHTYPTLVFTNVGWVLSVPVLVPKN